MLTNQSFVAQVKSVLDRDDSASYFLFYADIVNFQLINRYYGFQKGTQILDAIETFLSEIPTVLVSGRLFSDQFAFLVRTEKDLSPKDLISLFEDYSRQLLAEQRKELPDCTIKLSCGIYPITGKRDTNDIINALDGANLARKEAKRHGSGKAVFYDYEDLEKIVKYHDREREINFSLENRNFQFYLQPKVDLLTGEIVGAEALARRIDENGTLIYPDSFLPIMEMNGTIVELDYLIFTKVCAHLSARLKENLPVVPTSVNLSRLHVEDHDTAKNFHIIAQEYQIPPELLEFELTETILLNEFSEAKDLISDLRAYGYQVSIDDFGAGYAGINIWQELRFDLLKLDKKFLSDDPALKLRNDAIVPNVINIAQQLDTKVLCEGVETKEQCRYLLRLGCTLVQGFYFSHPVEAEEFYRYYMDHDGHYPRSFQKESASARIQPEENQRKKDRNESEERRKTSPYVPFVISCFFVHLFCAMITLGFFYHLSTRSFSHTDELVRYTVFITIFLIVTVFLSTILLLLYLFKWRHAIASDKQRYSLLEKFSDTILFDYDCQADVIHFTPNAAELFRVNAPTLHNFLRDLDDMEPVYVGDHPIVQQMLTGQLHPEKKDVLIRIKDFDSDRFLWYVIRYKYLYRRHRLISVIGKIDNIDDQKRHEQNLLEQAQRDGLTELYNKITTERQIEQAISANQSGILLLFDVDDFKQINDIFGHLAGDNALRIFAGCLQRIFRANDILGRIGGDELVVFMRGVNDPQVVKAKLEALWMMMEQELKETDIKFTASTGIARCPEDGKTFEALFRAADGAMYRAKKQDRNEIY